MVKIAIVSFTNYPKGQTRPCMAAVMRYAAQEEKTLWNGKRLVDGINCRPESVYSDFLNTKLLYHKDGGKLFFHMVQSFPKGADVDPITAHAAAMKLAEYFEGREVLVCTHTDRGHIHSHFIINSVSLEDGRKLHISEPQLAELRQRNDQVCADFGLPVFHKGQQKKSVKSMSTSEYHAAAKGESWKFQLINTIDECMRYAGSRDEFITLMRAEGYDVRWQDSRKNITYTLPSGMKCRDDRLHDEKYLKETMELELGIRRRTVNGGAEAAKPSAELTDAATASGNTHTAGDSSDRGGMGGSAESSDSARPPHCRTGSPVAGASLADGNLPDTGAGRGADAGFGGNTGETVTGWETERTAYIAAEASAAALVPGIAANTDYPAGALGSVVELGHALERNQNYAPAIAIPPHSDRKVLSKEHEKKIALGHKEEQTWQQTL